MILLYHKIDSGNKTQWWVSADTFYRQMAQLKHKKVVYLDDYDPNNSEHVVITFDGVYENLLKYAAPILKKFGYPFELFITGDTIGKGNEFDTVEPPCDFASKDTLRKLIDIGGRLQWHTKTHRKITDVKDLEVKAEVLPPQSIRSLDKDGFRWFGYAHGIFDDRSQDLVKKHYTGGLACENGSPKDKTIWPRLTVYEETQFIEEKVSVVIPCHNYASFLVEAIESVLRQTYLPDEILLSDDASTDHSLKIMQHYERKYPNLIKVNHNKTNFGIEKHFSLAVSKTTGDFVCFLGADNRFPSNYIEACITTHLTNPKIGVVYTDFILFGNRAESVYEGFVKAFKGDVLPLGAFAIKFPMFTNKSRKLLEAGTNFIHGSSMYKRKAYEEAGGYRSRDGGPEDFTLFHSMINKGWLAEKVPGIYLEYRQHSAEQANHQFAYFSELRFLREQFADFQKRSQVTEEELGRLQVENKHINDLYTSVHQELTQLKNSKFWKARAKYHRTKHAVRKPRTTIKKAAHKVRNTLNNS